MGCSGSRPEQITNNSPTQAISTNTNNNGLGGGGGADTKKDGSPPISAREHVQSTGSQITQTPQVNQARASISTEASALEVTMATVAPPTKKDSEDNRKGKADDETTADCETNQSVDVKTVTNPIKPESSTQGNTNEKNACMEIQANFNSMLNKLNLCVDMNRFLDSVDPSIQEVVLTRSPPHTLNLAALLSKLTNLQVLDVSNNQLGPQAFRLLMLALTTNTSIISVKAANNNADTDSSLCIGKLLTCNQTLLHLDVSGNHLGKDYFSRCVGPALKSNTTLQSLRCEGTGVTDISELLSGILENKSLRELDISNNEISDRQSIGRAMSTLLQKSDCILERLNIKNCNTSPGGLGKLCEGLVRNTSLQELNVSGNQFGSLETLHQFLQTAFCHQSLLRLTVDNIKVNDTQFNTDSTNTACGASKLHTLSLNNAGLTNDFLSMLESCFKGRLLSLSELNLSDNPSLNPVCINSLASMTKGQQGQSSIKRLTFGLNNAENIHEFVNPSCLPFLEYLNLRKSKISPASVGKLHELTAPPGGKLKTLVLDGLKLAGTDALKGGLVNQGESCLVALSLSGCLLSDDDLLPLTSALKSGLQLHMLKLSANRLTDKGVTDLVSSLLTQKSSPLAVLDLNNNQIGNVGAAQIGTLFEASGHESQLHSLNLSHNNINQEGIVKLVNVVGSHLKSLHLNNQRVDLDEETANQIFTALATRLGFQIKRDNSECLVQNCSPLSNVDSWFVNLSGLGGHAGDVGQLLDCGSIITDYRQKQLFNLSLESVCQIAAHLRKSSGQKVVLSSEEWDVITGCKKDREIPSWLQVSECRDRGFYLTNLPATATSRRLEGMFETEADCNIDEIFLLKDPVSRTTTGIAWGLMSDTDSVGRLMELQYKGEAQVFGQSFLVSRLLVTVDDEASAAVADSVRQDLERRAKERRKEESIHRNLIRDSADESWKRHAYRLAHPAYADGRIW